MAIQSYSVCVKLYVTLSQWSPFEKSLAIQNYCFCETVCDPIRWSPFEIVILAQSYSVSMSLYVTVLDGLHLKKVITVQSYSVSVTLYVTLLDD